MMEFYHPHIAVRVNDLSEYYEEVTGGSTILYQPFISDKGEDGVLSLETSLSEVINKYGKPNFKRHGQAYYNLIEWVKGGGRVRAHRIMPEDACYSHMILNVMTAPAFVPMYRRENPSAANPDRRYLLNSDNERIQWNTSMQGFAEDVDSFNAPLKPSITNVDDPTEVVSFSKTNPLIEISAYLNNDENSPLIAVQARIAHMQPNANEGEEDQQVGEYQVVDRRGPFNSIRLPQEKVPRLTDEGHYYTVEVRYGAGIDPSPSTITSGGNWSDWSDPIKFNVAVDAALDSTVDPVYEEDANFTPIMIAGKKYYKDSSNNVFTSGVKVKHEVVYLDSCDSKEDLSAENLKALTVARNTADAGASNGYRSHYLFAVSSPGRGVFGNLQRVNISLNKLYNDTYNYRIYDVKSLEVNPEYGTLNTVEGAYELSFYPDALTMASSSLNAQYVMDNAFKTIKGYYSEDVYDQLIADIEVAVSESNSADESWDDTSTIDFLFGQSQEGYGLYERMVIDSNSVSLDSSEGIELKGGSLGSFSMDNYHREIGANGLPTNQLVQNDAAYVNEKKNSLYAQAYQGILINEITSPKLYPVDVVLDANFPLTVKKAIRDFCNERKYHTFGYIDTNIQYSVESTLAWRRDSFQYTDWCLSIYAQNWIAEDAYSGKDINVTTTYFLASKIPYHDNTYGIHKPIAGPNYGQFEGFKTAKTSWYPTEYEKEDLYVARINYIERQPDQVRYMSQCTAQKKMSQLTEQNNVRVLFKMVQTAEDILDKFYFERANNATLNSISTTLTSNLNNWVSVGACDYVSAVASQTDEQRERKICGVNIGVKFTPVIERFDCVFEVRR